MCQSKMMRIYKRRSQSPRKAVGLLKPGPHVVRVAQRGQWPRSSVLLRFCSHENRSKFIDIGSLYTPDIHMCYCLTLYCTHYFIARRQIRCYRTVTLRYRGLTHLTVCVCLLYTRTHCLQLINSRTLLTCMWRDNLSSMWHKPFFN